MRRFFSQVRSAVSEIVDLWRDRDVHLPVIKEALREAPRRFRELDQTQKRYLIGLFALVICTQVYFVLS